MREYRFEVERVCRGWRGGNGDRRSFGSENGGWRRSRAAAEYVLVWVSAAEHSMSVAR